MYMLIAHLLSLVFGLILRRTMWVGKSWKSKFVGSIIAFLGGFAIGVVAQHLDDKDTDRKRKEFRDNLSAADAIIMKYGSGEYNIFK